MVRLKGKELTGIVPVNPNLHSTMVRLKVKHFGDSKESNAIYIPLWFD